MSKISTPIAPEVGKQFSATSLSAGRSWDSDIQETDYKTPLALYEHAESSQDIFRDFIFELRDLISAEIEIDDSNLLKPLNSIERKMHDTRVNYKPREICDPLRARYTVREGPNSIELLKRIMKLIQDHPQCTSFKNEYVEPDKDSHYSSFKARFKITGDDGRPITCELQIHHEGMLKANKLTALLSKSVRSIDEASRAMAEGFRSNDSSYRRHLENLSKASLFVDQVKRLIHDSARINSSLIDLIPAEKRSGYMVDGLDLGTIPKYAKFLIQMLPDKFIKRAGKNTSMTSEFIVDAFDLR